MVLVVKAQIITISKTIKKNVHYKHYEKKK